MTIIGVGDIGRNGSNDVMTEVSYSTIDLFYYAGAELSRELNRSDAARFHVSHKFWARAGKKR